MRLPAHLEGLVVRQETGGTYICVHDRQITLCPTCCPEAERRFEEAEKAIARRRGVKVDVPLQRAAYPDGEAWIWRKWSEVMDDLEVSGIDISKPFVCVVDRTAGVLLAEQLGDALLERYHGAKLVPRKP